MPTWKCSTWPSLTWPRTWVTSNQSRWRSVLPARSTPLRMACVDAVGRGADDLGDAVGAVRHGDLRCGRAGAGSPSVPTYDGSHGPGPARREPARRRGGPHHHRRVEPQRRHRGPAEALPALDDAALALLRRRDHRRAGARRLAVADPDRRRAGPAVRRRRDGQRRRSTKRDGFDLPDGRYVAASSASGTDRSDDAPDGARILDFTRSGDRIQREPGLPRPGSSWCRTASPVAVWHHFTFQEEYAVTDAASRPEPTSARPRAARPPPTWELLWNNPKLHTPDRRKIWLACDEHQQSLVGLPRRAQLPARTSSRTGVTPTAQPPMADIGRSGCRNVGSSMPWPARLPAHRDHPAVGDLVVGGARRAAPPRRSDSSRANRQLRTWPSAVSRTRSQSPQNGRVTEAITPTVAGPPSTWNSSAGRAPPRLLGRRQHELGLERREDLVGGDHARRATSRAGRRAASAR